MATSGCDKSIADSIGDVDGKKSDGIFDKVKHDSDETNKKSDIQDKVATTAHDQSEADSKGVIDEKKYEGGSDKVKQESDKSTTKSDKPDKTAATCDYESTAVSKGDVEGKKSEGSSDKVKQESDQAANKKPDNPDKTATKGDQSKAENEGEEDGKKTDGECISDKVLAELDVAYKTHGVPGITARVKASLDDWKTVPLNIAITGNSGVGKSSYINALLGISADDEGAAPVGVVETTINAASFSHPENNNLKLWDLSGVGTQNFPRESYLEKIKFKTYDFFLVITANRFTANDIWLAQTIRQLGKKFYFIRTKIDLDISSDKHDNPKQHTRDKVIETVRLDCIDQLKSQEFKTPCVFVISSFSVTEFDFGKLSECLIRNAPDLKREALTLSLSILTEDIIRAKEIYLKKRIYIVSIASAVAAAVPIPGVGFSVDISTLLAEALFYRNQFRLDDESVEGNAASLNISVTELKKIFDLQSQCISYTARGLLTFFGTLGVSKLSENVLKVALPVVGCLVAAGMSYGVQVYCLKQLLETMVKDALTINKEMNVVLAGKTV